MYVRALTAALVPLGTAGPAQAHAFGDRYDLPIPLWMLTTGAAAVVALSFVVMALFLRHSGVAGGYARFNLLTTAVGRSLAHPMVLDTVRGIFFLLFLLTLATGLFGDENPARNFSITMIWIIAWVGLAFASAFLGNIWTLISPWNTLAIWVEGAAGGHQPKFRCPEWLDAWPAAIMFLVFAWMEIGWDDASVPFNLAIALLVYSAITWLGMYLFGREAWLRRGEFFAVLFGLFARFAIMEIRVPASDTCDACVAFDSRLGEEGCVNCPQGFRRTLEELRMWNLRPPAVGLLVEKPPPIGIVVIILSVLASVTFDGFTETQQWRDVALPVYEFFRPSLNAGAITVVELIGVYSFPAMFIAAYLLGIFISALLAKRLAAYWHLVRIFAFSIIPIVLAYHLSHNFTQILVEGQYILSQSSDPFGFGWNLFGTATRQVEIGVIGARAFWFLSVTSIVTGHVVAVYLAHSEALAFFQDREKALLSQIPMIALMVGYTMISLWIIAQPVVV